VRCIRVLSIVLVSVKGLAPATPLQEKEQAAIVEFAKMAVIQALKYSHGDPHSLIDAQDPFTAEGWREVMKRMEGWLDSKGAPLGSSSFIPSGDVVITGQENGVIRLTVPGVLKQSQNTTTTYRVVVEVRMNGNPVKIGHLEPIVRLRGAASKTP
jgi:hypothetical protein